VRTIIESNIEYDREEEEEDSIRHTNATLAGSCSKTPILLL